MCGYKKIGYLKFVDWMAVLNRIHAKTNDFEQIKVTKPCNCKFFRCILSFFQDFVCRFPFYLPILALPILSSYAQMPNFKVL